MSVLKASATGNPACLCCPGKDPNCRQSCVCVVQAEAEPEVEHLFVSDATANSFRLSWTSDEDMFDRFVIKIRDSKRAGHPREYSVGGAERTKVITGLMSGTEYEIELYGVTLDERSQPITGVAQTGICKKKKKKLLLIQLNS